MRIEKGLKQTEFATSMALPQSRISQWENDVIEPNISQIRKIAEFFGVTTDFLLGVTNE